uniref:3'-5' exoribonuclease 1 n=1 Tax=Phallusia mammillata TaxID=59560 RepID=A0A6F9DCT5_9ASCI|nr:3'-5' exoribonuclease 1-like [Phallusia mammillata]
MDDFKSVRHNRPRRDDSEDIIDPVYHALSRINGRINRMTKAELQTDLNRNGLNERGVKEVLRKRLKNYYKKQKLRMKPLHEDGSQYYPYLVVIDFEATCEEHNPTNYLHEIIEFPAILVDTEKAKIVDKFHTYCQPVVNPTLSSFCTRLTGITQSTVEAAPLFPEVLEKFQGWLHLHGLLIPKTCSYVTDGSWDFSRFLNIQCCLSEVPYPKWAKKWINLKKVFGNFYGLRRPRILDMLQNIGLEFEGRPHCGLDDATNIAKIVLRLLEDGAEFQVNERLRAGKLEIISEKERLLLGGYKKHVTPEKNQSDVEKSVESLDALSISDSSQEETNSQKTTIIKL